VTLMGRLNTWRKASPGDPLATISRVVHEIKQLSMKTVGK